MGCPIDGSSVNSNPTGSLAELYERGRLDLRTIARISPPTIRQSSGVRRLQRDVTVYIRS